MTEYIIGKMTGARYLVSKFEGGEVATSQYIVELTSKGLICSCPVMDKAKKKTCKHCAMVQDKLDKGQL